MADYVNPIEFEPGQFTVDLTLNTHNSEDTEASGSAGSNQDGASAYTFDNYQDDTATTAIYPDADLGSPAAISYVILGLVGEAGEIANKYKKVLRDDSGAITSDSLIAIGNEIGDVLWYSARLASELGIPLSIIAASNYRKLNSRKQQGKLHGSGDDR